MLLHAASGGVAFAAAPARTVTIDVPAGSLAAATAALSRALGVSIGWAGSLPPLAVRRVRGRLTADDALRRLLRGTGLRAVRVGDIAFRIEPEPPAPIRPARPAPRTALDRAPLAPAGPDEILVTAQKRTELLLGVPGSIAVVDPTALPPGRLGAAGQDVALQTEGLALTNLGPGKNRQFIRGVADSAFNGPSQSTVAVQLDEARLTFNAPDPDLRLVDVARVEILKGPQGPLYGSGALGGIYHIVTRKPALDAIAGAVAVSTEALTEGGPGGGTEGMLNLPIVSDRLALRVVGYGAHEGGWINDPGGARDTNSARTLGGRAALRWQPDVDWTIDVAGVEQDVTLDDSQYVTGTGERLDRGTRVREPTDNDFRALSATVQGRIGGLALLAAASRINQSTELALDASDAAPLFGRIGPALYRSDGDYEVSNQEVRLSPVDGRHWLIGASALRAQSTTEATLETAADTLAVERLDRVNTEIAVFGETSFAVARNWEARLGARVSHTIADDEALERSRGTSDRSNKTWLSPSLALSWQPTARSTVYLRYARSLRPGGLAATADATVDRFDADELGTFDLGYRGRFADGALKIAASAFYTDWSDVQSDFLLDNGLVSTRNAGRARILGAEASFAWTIAPRLAIEAGAAFVNALLVKTADGSKLDDRHLPVTPDLTGRLRGRYSFRLGRWSGSAWGQANYIGRSRLSFDQTLDRRMGNYATFLAAAALERGGVTIAARIDNLLDARGNSFAFGNPFSIRQQPQFTPLRPRAFSLTIARAW